MFFTGWTVAEILTVGLHWQVMILDNGRMAEHDRYVLGSAVISEESS
jgi:hypothetical protein